MHAWCRSSNKKNSDTNWLSTIYDNRFYAVARSFIRISWSTLMLPHIKNEIHSFISLCQSCSRSLSLSLSAVVLLIVASRLSFNIKIVFDIVAPFASQNGEAKRAAGIKSNCNHKLKKKKLNPIAVGYCLFETNTNKFYGIHTTHWKCAKKQIISQQQLSHTRTHTQVREMIELF